MEKLNKPTFSEQKIQELENRITELEAIVQYYEEQLRLAKHRQFGISSERSEDYEQLGFFDEVENTADPKAAEQVTVEEITYTRKKPTGKRADDICKLEVETIVYKLEDEECMYLTIHIEKVVKDSNRV